VEGHGRQGLAAHSCGGFVLSFFVITTSLAQAHHIVRANSFARSALEAEQERLLLVEMSVENEY